MTNFSCSAQLVPNTRRPEIVSIPSRFPCCILLAFVMLKYMIEVEMGNQLFNSKPSFENHQLKVNPKYLCV